MESKVEGDGVEGNQSNCLWLLLVGFRTTEAVNLL